MLVLCEASTEFNPPTVQRLVDGRRAAIADDLGDAAHADFPRPPRLEHLLRRLFHQGIGVFFVVSAHPLLYNDFCFFFQCRSPTISNTAINTIAIFAT